jgi:amidase
MTELAWLPAKRLAALVRRRKIGCLELLDHMLARVERLDGRLNAVVVRDFTRARAAARKLDRKGEPAGALHGVPMTVKESFDIAGLPTTWGVPDKHDMPQRDALAVRRLKAAGAVVFGKTNVPRALGDWQSFNDIYGVTNNPWDLSRSPGGSSGGGAAALAAGLSALEAGSDIGGSIRQPAHACGVFGHKPTWGLLALRGQSFTPDAASTTDISCIGPLARSAADLSMGLQTMAGPDPEETAFRYALPAPRVRGLRGLRVAVWPRDEAGPTDPEISTALEALATALRREGAKVSLTARPAFAPREAFEVTLELLSMALSGRASPEELEAEAARAAEYGADATHADAVVARASGASHGAWLVANERRLRLRRAWGSFFQDWDVLLCPAFSAPALPHRHEAPTHLLTLRIDGRETRWNEMLFWPGIVGGFYLPASVAPLGISREGLPFGVQIVGPLYGDRTTLMMAAALERSWLGYTPPPGWD